MEEIIENNLEQTDEEFSYSFVFPAPFVWWKKLKDHETIKEKYLPLIEEDYNLNKDFYNSKNSWNCDVTTSFFEELKICPLFDDNFCNDVIWNPIDEMLADMTDRLDGIRMPIESKVKQLWYNRYQPGNWQEIHNHQVHFSMVSFSGIYLLDLNEENTTTFYTTQANYSCYSPDYNPLCVFKTNHIPEGSIIIFPSELSHYVNPCVNSRTTISFNIVSNYGDLPSS